jgi:hypothetical protein
MIDRQHNESRQYLLSLSVPLSRFVARVGSGSAFVVKLLRLNNRGAIWSDCI